MGDSEAATSAGQPPQAGSLQMSQSAQESLVDVSETPQHALIFQQNPVNHKVTFKQKKAMLDYIMAHRELALSDNINENLWIQLTNDLNNMRGGVKSCEEWKSVWKLWCNTYKKRKNDLSITLLDLRLIVFLESITDNERKITALKQFANGTTSLLSACDLFSFIPAVPALAKNNFFMKTVDFLKLAEETEEAYKTKVDYNKKKLHDLTLKKQEIEKDIDFISKTLNDNEKHHLDACSEKNELLKKIRNCIKLTFMPSSS